MALGRFKDATETSVPPLMAGRQERYIPQLLRAARETSGFEDGGHRDKNRFQGKRLLLYRIALGIGNIRRQ